MFRPLIVAALLAAWPAFVAGQEPPVKSSPAALDLLDRAAAHQGPEDLAIADLSVRIGARVWDYNQQPPQELALEVRRFLTLEPERFRSEWKTGQGRQLRGFDGKRYWYADDEGSRFLAGDLYAKDRQEIREEMDETRHLLRLFFLGNLRSDTVRFLLRPDETVDLWGESFPCRVLRRENLDPGSTEPPLDLWIGARDFRLHRAAAVAERPGEKSLRFDFRYDEELQPRVKGVLFPLKIEIWEQPFEAPAPRIKVRAAVEEDGGIEFNTSPDPKIFLRP